MMPRDARLSVFVKITDKVLAILWSPDRYLYRRVAFYDRCLDDTDFAYHKFTYMAHNNMIERTNTYAADRRYLHPFQKRHVATSLRNPGKLKHFQGISTTPPKEQFLSKTT